MWQFTFWIFLWIALAALTGGFFWTAGCWFFGRITSRIASRG